MKMKYVRKQMIEEKKQTRKKVMIYEKFVKCFDSDKKRVEN